MTAPQRGEPFERIEEYKALLDNLADLSARRQNINNVYVGLNTIFLTAVGIFVSTHLNLMMWSTAISVGVMALAIFPLNLVWLISLRRYAKAANFRYNYLRQIEQEFCDRRGATSGNEIGLFLQFKAAGLHKFGNTQLERFLARYFLYFYLVVTAVITVLTWLVQNHLITPWPSL